MQAIDEIVPTLLHALEDDETSDTALDGLKQILRSVTLYSAYIGWPNGTVVSVTNLPPLNLPTV